MRYILKEFFTIYIAFVNQNFEYDKKYKVYNNKSHCNLFK